MTTSDEQLVAQYLAGNSAALEALVSKYLRPLYNFVFQLVKDTSAAEDIVQDTFLKAWKNFDRFEANKKFSTWIFAIAKNTAFDWLKKKKSPSFSALENEEGESWLENIADEKILSNENLLARFDSEKNVQEVLDELTPKMRTVLLLHHKYGFSLVEIAQIMQTPHNTLKSKYRRTLGELRKKFSEKMFYLSQKTPKEVDRKSI